jgi:hypothetical protein
LTRDTQDPLVKEDLARIEKRVRAVGRRFRRFAAWFFLSISMINILVFCILSISGPVAPLEMLMGSIVVGAIGLAAWQDRFGFDNKRVRAILLEERLCPSCVAPLPQDAGADGCIRCADCGAAWRPPTDSHAGA